MNEKQAAEKALKRAQDNMSIAEKSLKFAKTTRDTASLALGKIIAKENGFEEGDIIEFIANTRPWRIRMEGAKAYITVDGDIYVQIFGQKISKNGQPRTIGPFLESIEWCRKVKKDGESKSNPE